jgi:hypothetical protein
MNLAAIRFFQAADHTQRRGFAAAARSQQREKFAFGDFQVNAIDRGHFAECFIKILYPEKAHLRFPCPSMKNEDGASMIEDSIVEIRSSILDPLSSTCMLSVRSDADLQTEGARDDR